MAQIRVATRLISIPDLKASLTRLAPGESPDLRQEGRDWPAQAETMIGHRRLDQLEDAINTILAEDIPGDVVETGVWRGGACILMRAILKNAGSDRIVWVADSFQGLPRPSYPQDQGDTLWQFDELAVPLAEVQANFRRYGLLDDHVRFLPGWFRDTLPTAPITQLAILRLDGDMYESTWDALTHLYPKVTPGGYVIVDDYGAIPACRQAVRNYRDTHQIQEPIEAIDWGGVYWRTNARTQPSTERLLSKPLRRGVDAETPLR